MCERLKSALAERVDAAKHLPRAFGVEHGDRRTGLEFGAREPAPGLEAAVASPPYDVVDTDEARALVAGRPLSFLRVGRSEVELPEADGGIGLGAVEAGRYAVLGRERVDGVDAVDNSVNGIREFATTKGATVAYVPLTTPELRIDRARLRGLLDEPATFLDLSHQLAIYRLLAQLAEQGLLIIAATHDLNLAASFAGRNDWKDLARLRIGQGITGTVAAYVRARMDKPKPSTAL